MTPLRRTRARLKLALVLLLGACCSGRETTDSSPAGAPAVGAAPPQTVAVRLADADPALEGAVREGGFFRWALPELGWVRVKVGPEARGDLELLVDRLPAGEETLQRLAGLPVQVGEGVVLAGTRYLGPHLLAVRIPGAERPTWVLLGAETAPLADLVNELLFQLAGHTAPVWGRPEFDYLVQESRYLQRSGKWLRQGEAWGIDPEAERDDLAARERFYAALVTVPGTRAVVLRAPPELAARPELARLAAALDRTAAVMAAKVPVELTEPLTLIVETDFTAQGRHTGAVGEAVLGHRADLHLVFHPDDLHAYRYALAAVLLRRAGLAEGLAPWLARGAALWLAEEWYGRRWREWLPALAATGTLPAAEELLAAEEQSDSSALLWTPAAAAVVDALPGATLREKLTAPMARERVGAALAAVDRLPAPTPPPASADVPSGFLAGVSLAMSNSLDGGYHAPGIERTLDAVTGLGANAVSLMPFAFQRDPASPALGFRHDNPRGETDVGLVHAARRSRARGVSVLWKPHIWVGHESWPGEIAMQSEEDWRQWWRGYRRYVLHHAFLARWAEADLFAVGVELSRTLGRAEEWRRLIEDVRRLYPGPLTYAGNWDGDLERAPFWDRLDLLGVDAYFPLASSPAATPAELAAGAERVRERLAAAAAKHGKPVLLTEVGFAARRGAWIEPHVEGGDLSVEDQERAYQALFAGLGKPPWLAGSYVWKVFSGPRRRGGEPGPDFQLLGRPAEAVVRAYYKAP